MNWDLLLRDLRALYAEYEPQLKSAHCRFCAGLLINSMNQELFLLWNLRLEEAFHQLRNSHSTGALSARPN